MYNRKHGPCWPASPLGRARPSAIQRCSLPPPAPCLPFPPDTLPCSTNSTRATKDSAVYMYVCCMCVRACVNLWVYNIQCLYYSTSLPSSLACQLAVRRCWPLLPCTPLGDPTVHRFPAVCVPPCSPPVPAPSCMMLLFFQAPQAAESSPPVGGGSRLPQHGELGPRWFPGGGSPFLATPLFIPRPATTVHCRPCG